MYCSLQNCSKKYHFLTFFCCFCALFFAYFSEFFYKLTPCSLCVYERYFLVIILLASLYNIIFQPKKYLVPSLLFSAFFLSIFHILVEKNVLIFQCKSAKTPTIKSFLKMLSTPNCNYPTWEIFGISATIYYAILTGGFFIIHGLNIYFESKKK